MKRRNKNDPILFDLTVTQDNVNSSLKEVARDFIAKPIGKPPVFPDEKQKRCILFPHLLPLFAGQSDGKSFEHFFRFGQENTHYFETKGEGYWDKLLIFTGNRQVGLIANHLERKGLLFGFYKNLRSRNK